MRTPIMRVHMADSIHGQEPLEVAILVGQKLPSINEISTPELAALYQTDAEKIVTALADSLPQATFRRVLIEMLVRTTRDMLYRGTIAREEHESKTT